MRRRINFNGLMATPALENDQVQDQPVVETPAVTETPTDGPMETPPAETPPVETPVPETPPVETPAAEIAPVDEKVAEAPAAVATPDTAVPVTPAAAEPAPGADLPDMSDTVETSLNESAEMETDVGQVVDEANAAVEVAECLESLRDVLQSSVAEGGIDQYSAGALKIATEALHDSVGVSGYSFPSADKFASVSGRMRYTQLAMEGLGETLKKIWDAIVRVVKASVEWLVERFQLLFISAEKIQKRAMELAERAKRTKHQPKTTVFKNAGFVKALQIAGKVDAIKASTTLDHEVHVTLDHFRKSVTVYDALLNLLGGKEQSFNPVIAAVADVGNNLQTVSNPSAAGLSLPPGTSVVRRGDELPGGKAVVAFVAVIDGVEKDIEEATKRILATRVEITEAYPQGIKEADGDQELTVLTPHEVLTLANNVNHVTMSFESYKKLVESMKSTKKRIIERAEAQAKAADAEKTPEGAKAAQSLAKLAPWAMRIVEQPCAGFTLYALNTCKTLLDYGTTSLKDTEDSQHEAHDKIDKMSQLASKTQAHVDARAKQEKEEKEKAAAAA